MTKLSLITSGQLLEEVEELENLCGQYEVQAASMDGGTVDTMENVRKAEEEIRAVKSQINKVVANWTNTVININKVECQRQIMITILFYSEGRGTE